MSESKPTLRAGQVWFGPVAVHLVEYHSSSDSWDFYQTDGGGLRRETAGIIQKWITNTLATCQELEHN